MNVLLISDGEFTYSENTKIKVFKEKGKTFASFDNIGIVFEIAYKYLIEQIKESIIKNIRGGLEILFLEVDFENELIKDCWE